MRQSSRWIVATLLITVVVVGLANVAAAGKGKAKGMDLFKEYCKPCHLPDSPNGEYTPMTLIIEQWERFFEEKWEETHGEVLDPNHGDQPVTEVISQEDLKAIAKFAEDHAADSEQPMTCG